MALNLRRKTWRKIGYSVFIPLGLIFAGDFLVRGEQLRAAALAIQVFGALFSLPFARLVRWPFSEAARFYSGVFAIAVFMVGKFLEWYLRNSLTYAIGGTLVLLVLGAVLWWTGRELRVGADASA